MGALAHLLAAIGLAAAAQASGNLATNGGFEAGGVDIAPGWERLGWSKDVSLDGGVAHSGRRSLRVGGHGGMQTTPIPYAGGRLKISGWVRTENVARGPSRAWHMAALQLISLDGAGKSVGHTDVVLLEGTHDWARYETVELLSREVASVAVCCHLWGEDTTGTAWFDDISIEPLDDPAALSRRPLDKAKAAVAVDFRRDLGEFRHLWVGSDVAHMDRVETATQINAMKQARRAGFRYVRMHNCVHNPGIYSEDAEGNPVYRWEVFDRRIRLLAENGMWPVIVLEGMPPCLAAGDDKRGWENPYPPKGPAEYLKWQRLVRELVAHCRQTWGDGIRNWYFEVWNEPDASGYFRGTQAEYLRLYDHAVAGAVFADPGIRIGGPGGAGTGWCAAFLEHCRTGRNDATGGTGCRVDFLSWHIYTIGVGIPVFDNIRLSLGGMRRLLDASPAYRKLPTLITEWGCASSNNGVHDRPYDAAFRAMAVREFLDHGITLALPFALADGPQHAHDGFQGNLGLFTKTTIPKPGFRTFELLGRMVGRRVSCESSNDPVGGLACLAPDRRKAWVLLYNLVERLGDEGYSTAAAVKLSGLLAGRWSCRATLIAPGECDPQAAWVALGRPESLTPEQQAKLQAASELPPARPVEVKAGAVSLSLPGFSVVLLEFDREDRP